MNRPARLTGAAAILGALVAVILVLASTHWGSENPSSVAGGGSKSTPLGPAWATFYSAVKSASAAALNSTGTDTDLVQAVGVLSPTPLTLGNWGYLSCRAASLSVPGALGNPLNGSLPFWLFEFAQYSGGSSRGVMVVVSDRQTSVVKEWQLGSVCGNETAQAGMYAIDYNQPEAAGNAADSPTIGVEAVSAGFNESLGSDSEGAVVFHLSEETSSPPDPLWTVEKEPCGPFGQGAVAGTDPGGLSVSFEPNATGGFHIQASTFSEACAPGGLVWVSATLTNGSNHSTGQLDYRLAISTNASIPLYEVGLEVLQPNGSAVPIYKSCSVSTPTLCAGVKDASGASVGTYAQSSGTYPYSWEWGVNNTAILESGDRIDVASGPYAGLSLAGDTLELVGDFGATFSWSITL